jgi:hypothetical protein
VATNARLTFVIAEGAWGTVECAVLESGDCPALEFLTGALASIREGAKGQPEKGAVARFMVVFQMMANYGAVAPKRHKREMDFLSAFRHEVKNLQIRFPCFRDGDRWILTHGFIKPGAKKKLGEWPQSEVDRAKNIKTEYFKRKDALEKNAKRDKWP